MDRFERFMEAWGLLTLDLSRSGVWYRRWAGIAIGALAVWLMLLVMAFWYAVEVTKLAFTAVCPKAARAPQARDGKRKK